jgi:hypothetical protein
MSRKKRRRRRTPSLAPTPTINEPRDLTEAERSRLLQRFMCMRGRSVTVGYVPIGPVVEASTPEELVAATDAAIVAATIRQRPS